MGTRNLSLVLIIAIVAVVSTVHAARPVARWDVIPDQLIDAPFKVGVVAMHVEGVKVEFRVNGSLVHTAMAPTYNDRTNVWEHWFELDPAGYPDGPLTIAARSVCLNPTAANPSYDLNTITLFANSGGTLGSSVVKWVDGANGSDSNAGTQAAPYATLAKAVSNTPPGGTVYIQPGTYSADRLGGGSSRDTWTTVSAAPGVDREDVKVGKGRPGTQRVRWVGVTFFSTSTSGSYDVILTGENGSHLIWLDNCKAHNVNGRYAASTALFGNRYVSYLTGGIGTNLANGPGGIVTRDYTLDTITSDAFTGEGKLVVNCQCIGIDPGTTGAHPDFHQSYAVSPDFCEDVILYNVRGYECESQGLFGSRLRNAAFVNVLFERVPDSALTSQYSGAVHNVLFLHINIINQSWNWRETSLDAQDVKVYNSVFGNMNVINGASTDGIDADSNHFTGTATLGTNYTTGDVEYLDPSTRDYALASTSPAWGGGRPLQCVPADIDGQPRHAATPNPGAYAMGEVPDPPVANAGGDRTVVDADGDGMELILLDGTASTSGGQIVGYQWTEDASPIGLNAQQWFPLTTFGEHVVTLRVIDEFGAEDIDTVTITFVAGGGQPGDADGDGDVDLNDFVVLKTNFGLQENATVAQGDFDGDGDVDLEDFVILKTNFGAGS